MNSIRLHTLARSVALAAACLLATSCNGPLPRLPAGEDAYRLVPAPQGNTAEDYRIGPLDLISVTVFQEPDLTLKEVPVDSSGQILLPLIGSTTAANKTSTQLAHEIAAKLEDRYLRDAQVTVLVETSAKQRVTVEGEVRTPGIYPIQGRTTLIDAVALAQGPSQYARVKEVVVFRDIDGIRAGALFDLGAIRRGEADDPEILAGDRVVVGQSRVKSVFRDLLAAAPFTGLFYQILQTN